MSNAGIASRSATPVASPSVAATAIVHVEKSLSLDEAAGRLLLALLHLRDTGEALWIGIALREYAAAGRREEVDRTSLETELRTLYDAVFRIEADAFSPGRDGLVRRLAECYGRGGSQAERPGNVRGTAARE